MKMQKNNYAFIDSQNLNLATRDAGWHLDFSRFRSYLRDKYSLVEYFMEQEKLCKVIIPNQERYSVLLKKLCPPDNNIFNFLNSLKEKLEYKKKK